MNQPAEDNIKRKIVVDGLRLWYGKHLALKGITLGFRERTITALIGPSGCGKSTLLRTLNRMNDTIPGVRIQGKVLLDDRDIYADDTDVVQLRTRVGMVFQRPNVFPLSVYDNVAAGPRIHGIIEKHRVDPIVERSLKDVGLWDDLKNGLGKPALALSLGQQQQLCLARAIAMEPEVILLDEPASALDPVSTLRLEELMRKLEHKYTIIIVTHNMQQASRASDHTIFMLSGELVEEGPTAQLFTAPKQKRTEEYVTGKFG